MKHAKYVIVVRCVQSRFDNAGTAEMSLYSTLDRYLGAANCILFGLDSNLRISRGESGDCPLQTDQTFGKLHRTANSALIAYDNGRVI